VAVCKRSKVKETKRLQQNGERGTRTSNKPHTQERESATKGEVFTTTGCATKVQPTTAVRCLTRGCGEVG
jgi:hypothetical protein